MAYCEVRYPGCSPEEYRYSAGLTRVVAPESRPAPVAAEPVWPLLRPCSFLRAAVVGLLEEDDVPLVALQEVEEPAPLFFFFFLKEKLAPLQDLKHSTLCSKYSTGYFKKPHLVVAPTALPQEDSVVPNVRRECRQPNKQRA